MSKDLASKKAQERREKLRQIRRKQQLRLVLFVFLIGAVLAVLVWLYRSDLFRVKKIEVTGNNRLSDSQIEKISAIEPGSNLVRLPLKEIEGRLLKDSWIKDVEISRSFPNTLKIKVAERKAIAVIPVDDGNAVVDEEGLVLEKISNIDKVNLLLIRDLDVRKVKVGQKIKSKSFSNASLCLSHLDEKLRKSLNIISAPSVDKLALYTNEGAEIIYGKAENFEKKNYIINKILSKGDEVIFIDIRVISNPVIKKRP